MYIYLIRHGESLANISNYLKDDDNDLGLSDKGVFQINLLKDKIVFNKNDKIYTSPLKRALQTSNILFGEKKKLIIKEFRELDKGFSKGKYKDFTWDKWKKFFLENYSEFSKKNWNYPNGESLLDLENRVIPKFLDIVKSNKSDNSNIYIVSHNWVIKIILGYILGCNIGYFNLKINNGAVIKIEFTAGNFSIII